MSSPVTALTGTFMLWFAWLAFNCGSTFGIQGDLWKIASKVAVTTINSSIGGSMAGLVISALVNRKSFYFDIGHQIQSILGGLVAITAGCSVFLPAEALLIGFIGGSLAVGASSLLLKFQIDDPVGAIPVHLFASIWGVLAVGLFGNDASNRHSLGMSLIMAWSLSVSFLVFFLLKKTVGIRMTKKDEILGADWTEHRVRSENFAMKLEKAMLSMNLDKEEESAVAKKIMAQLAAARINSGTTQVDDWIRNISGPHPKHRSSSVLRWLDLAEGKTQSGIIANYTRVYPSPTLPGSQSSHQVSSEVVSNANNEAEPTTQKRLRAWQYTL